MAYSDPISEGSPSGKRRRLNNGSQSKAWNSDEDSGDELFEEPQTVATIPLKRTNDISQRMQPSTFVTQPTQARTQPYAKTQHTSLSQAPTQDVQVERSSPPLASSPPPRPAPVKSALKSTSLLASMMPPRGTALRPPVPRKQKSPDFDSEESDPPVEDSSDDGNRALTSNIRPTQFKRGGQEIHGSSPGQVIAESPRPPSHSTFSQLISQAMYGGDAMASSYGSASRAPRPPQQARPVKAKVMPQLSGSPYQTLEDIDDFRVRNKIERMQAILGEHTPVARCLDALKRKHMNLDDAMNFLVGQDSERAPIENPRNAAKAMIRDMSATKSAKQEVMRPAHSITERYNTKKYSESQDDAPPRRQSTKQTVDAPIRGIADRYSTQRRQPDTDELQGEDEPPRRKRLQKGRRPRPRSSSPDPLSTVQPRRQPKYMVIDDDSEDDRKVEADSDASVVELPSAASTLEQRVLSFVNDTPEQDLLDLTAQPDTVISVIVSARPFATYQQVSDLQEPGLKRRTKLTTGQKFLEVCEELLEGFEALDDLVDKCEALAKPIKDTLDGWGIGLQDKGELEMTKLDDIHDSGIGSPSSNYSDGKRKQTKAFLKQPSNMSSDITMKDYQLVGLNWLRLLYTARTSCILADDMGLGKTCQVIAFLAQLQLEEVEGLHLIVVPASTLENWLRELNRFAPSLRIMAYHGLKSARDALQDQVDEDRSDYDVIVTTYEMAVSDNKWIRTLDPVVCVYDEAHQLKNTKSQRYTKLMRIRADFKVLLTGTPLQNNLQELVAILAFIMPDLFSEKKEELERMFKYKASTTGGHGTLLAAQRTDRARSMLTPFILRRKKTQVLDLPAKHSRVEYCTLTDSQASIYNGYAAEVLQLFEDREAGYKTGGSAGHLDMLLKLRKAAIHPLLDQRLYTDSKIEKIADILGRHPEFGNNSREKIVKYLTGEGWQRLDRTDYAMHKFCLERDYLHRFALHRDEWMDSGKVHKVKELLHRFIENGDRCLIFSQFVIVLDILEAVLDTLGIKFLRLDGSTHVDVRQSMIDKFYDEEDITVFLLTTKAGGAGINLAAANKVIIFDSGFNPQDDVQAENRAHRVGQTRDVEVIRLVTKDTIEEQIHALGISKLALDQKVAGEGAANAEKAGAEIVERMMIQKLKGEESVEDAFKKGLQDNGLQID